MRRLFFIPVLAFLALSPLAGCDTGNGLAVLDGTWALTRVVDQTGEEIAGPTGSLLIFDDETRFRIESGNDCSGTYRSEFIVNEQIFDLDFGACTEIGTTFETDLSIVLGAFERNVSRQGPYFFGADVSRMEIYVSTLEAFLTLTFEAQ